jgi:hypothetical protein
VRRGEGLLWIWVALIVVAALIALGTTTLMRAASPARPGATPAREAPPYQDTQRKKPRPCNGKSGAYCVTITSR